MSDERNELLKHFNEITKEYHQHCEWTNDKYSAVEKIRQLIQLGDKWLPTVKNINALPEPIRKYIHDLETSCDPAGMVQANTIMKDLCNQLEAKLIQQEPEIDEKYVGRKLIELIQLNSRFPKSVQQRDELNRNFITQIISDARGGAISKENLKISEAKIKEK